MPSPIPAFAFADRPHRFREPPVGHFVEEWLAGREGPRGKDFNMRWVAFMVADA